MRRLTVIFSFIAMVAMVAAWAPSASAFGGPVTNCVGCHPGFAGGTTAPGHAAHLSLGLACNACHEGAFNVSGTNSALCAQCHVAPGLPNHHENAGAASCVACHPGTPAPESTPPPGYAAVGLNPCNGSEEIWAGSFTVSLDNDGDLLYDCDDPDCGNDPACAPVDLCAGVNCDDGDVCNGTETCDPATGNCVAGTPLVCDDGQFCNGAETCDPAAGCVNGMAPCDPATETCNEGSDSCDPIVTGCMSDADCNDNNACTDDTCDMGTGNCSNTPISCDDGMFCNGTESCDPAMGCMPGSDPCAPNECDEINDACISGCTMDSQCDDGMYCNGAETCDIPSGQCQMGMHPCGANETCDEGTDTCVPENGTCEPGFSLVCTCVDVAPPPPPPPAGPPADHTDEEDGALHKPGKDKPYSNGCIACHGQDLKGGIGPSCYTCHGMEWDEEMPDMGGGFNPPADHTDNEDGAMHAPGKNRPMDNGCTACHGADLKGAFGPSCYTCHGREWYGGGYGDDSSKDD